MKQVCPQRIARGAPVLARYAVWTAAHLRGVMLEARQGKTLLWRKLFGRLQPERRIFPPVAEWMARLEPGIPVQITVV